MVSVDLNCTVKNTSTNFTIANGCPLAEVKPFVTCINKTQEKPIRISVIEDRRLQYLYNTSGCNYGDEINIHVVYIAKD